MDAICLTSAEPITRRPAYLARADQGLVALVDVADEFTEFDDDC